MKNSLHQHLILCSQTLVLIDERSPNKPLLSWRHFMSNNENSPVYLNNSYLPIDGGLNIASCCNSTNKGFVYQFSNSSSPISYEFALQLDDFSTLSANMSRIKGDCFDRTLNRTLLSSPVIGSTHLQDGQNPNSFHLIRVHLLFLDVYNSSNNRV